jgi:hypothetical protein
MECYVEYVKWAPVGDACASFTVLCSHYDVEVNKKVLKEFCCDGTSDSIASYLDVEDLDRSEGGFQFVLKEPMRKDYVLTDIRTFSERIRNKFNDASITATSNTATYDTSSASAFEKECQIRYSSLSPEQFGESFALAKLVTFLAYPGCPLRIFLELYRPGLLSYPKTLKSNI